MSIFVAPFATCLIAAKLHRGGTGPMPVRSDRLPQSHFGMWHRSCCTDRAFVCCRQVKLKAVLLKLPFASTSSSAVLQPAEQCKSRGHAKSVVFATFYHLLQVAGSNRRNEKLDERRRTLNF